MTESIERLCVPSDRDASGRSFGDEELALLAEVLRAGTLNSNAGTMVRRFEAEFAEALGARHAIACSSGSFAVQAAAACYRRPGAVAITSPVTDFGALTALVYEGFALRFCDVDSETLVPGVAHIEAAVERARASGEDIALVVATHLFGRPAPVDEIADYCSAKGIPLVEDAAQTLGSLRAGKAPGLFAPLGTFSFQQGKHISSGEGGAVVTDDDALARRVRLFVNKAWPYGEPDPDHVFVAPNGRMTELQAAVLVAQLAKLDGLIEARCTSAAALIEALPDTLRFVAVPGGDRHSFWRVALIAADSVDLDALVAYARDRGLACQARYVGRPAFALKALRDLGHDERVEDYPGVARGLARCLVLPWNEGIDPELARRIAAVLTDAVANASEGVRG